MCYSVQHEFIFQNYFIQFFFNLNKNIKYFYTFGDKGEKLNKDFRLIVDRR